METRDGEGGGGWGVNIVSAAVCTSTTPSNCLDAVMTQQTSVPCLSEGGGMRQGLYCRVWGGGGGCTSVHF
jgi:hypothetical protein